MSVDTRAIVTPTPGTIAQAYLPLVYAYFPADQWSFATCIMEQEIAAALLACTGAPETCAAAQPGQSSCYPSQTQQVATAFGLYQILDVCWDPNLAGTNTPFTLEEWVQVFDPNYNVWMSSVIFSISGWRAWTTCGQCNACEVVGEPIPYPRGPVIPAPAGYTATPLYLGVALTALAGVVAVLATKDGRGA